MSRTPPKPPPPPQAPDLGPPEVIEIVEEAISIDTVDLEPVSLANQPFSVPMPAPPMALDEFIDIPVEAPLGLDDMQIDMDDLPTPSAIDLGNIDLPTPAPLLTPVPASAPSRPQGKAVASPLDDLPDIPMETTQHVMSNSLLDSDMGAPPSLMDDLPTAAPVEYDGTIEVDMPSVVTQTETVSDAVDLSSLPDLDGGSEAPGDDTLVAVKTGVGQEVSLGIAAKPTKKRWPMLVGAVSVLALLGGGGAAAVWLTPLGRMVGLRPAPKPVAVAVKPAPKPAATPAAAPALPAVPPVETPKATIERLTRDNVDRLAYPSLAAGVRALAHSTPSGEALGLLRWARFRLASTFADAEAKAAMLAGLAEKPEAKPHPLSSMAMAGAAQLWGKPPQIKHAMGRLKGPLLKTPQGMYVDLLGQSRKKVVPPKTLALLDKLREQSPAMIDADLLRADILMARKDHSEGMRAWVDLARRADPDIAARAAITLQRAEEYGALQEAVEALGDGKNIGNASPDHQEGLWRWMVRGRLQHGDTAGALQAAVQRSGVAPQSPAAWVEAARMTQYEDGDGTKVLSDGMAKVTDAESKARLAYEKVLIGLHKKDDEAVQGALKEGLALPTQDAGGWVKMAEGAVALDKGDAAAAHAAFTAAGKGRPNFDEAKLALLALNPVKPDDAAALVKWSHTKAMAEIMQRTIAALEARGDYVAATKEQELLLWTDPTLTDPVEGMLHWIDLVDRGGEALRAETLAEALAAARSDDDRPPLQIVDMARRGKRWDSMVKWYNALLSRHPNHRVYTVALANGYIEAGKSDKALALLEALAKADPEARNEDFLYTEGRAWGAQDVVKARGFLQAAIKLKPNTRAYILLGELEQQRGKNDEALAAYREALQLDPTQTSIQLRLAKILIIKGFTKEAIEELTTLLSRNARDGEAGELLGDALREQGDTAGALAAYTKAQPNRSEAQLPPLLMKIARLQLQELGQTGLSIKTLRALLKIEPKNPEAHYYLGLALRDSNQRPAARIELQTYLHLAPAGEFAAEVQEAVDSLGRAH